MNTGAEAQHPYYDPDMRLPPAVLHFFPVVLALFTLTMSVAGYSIFHGFDEDEPITWMSLTLMLAVLACLLAVIRNPALESFKRGAAVVLSAVTVFAVLDEQQRWHEKVGRYVKNDLEIFNRDVRHYTDDVIVILFALAGTVLIFRFLRQLSNRRAYVPYAACVAALAFAHGFLDVLGHGGRLWRVLTPDMTENQIDLLTETLGFYEEACKLWAEWFVLLFVLRFFHGQRGPLAWSILVMIGSFLSGIGLWAIEDPSAGVPYLVMERTLRFLRNYHLLLALASIFTVWALAAWRLFGDQPRKQALAGLFFVTPFYAVLPEITRAASGMLAPARLGVTALASAALLAVAAILWRRGNRRGLLIFGAAVAVILGLAGASIAGLAGQPLLLLSIGGVFWPAALVLLAGGRKDFASGPLRSGALFAGLALCALLVQNPLWLLGAFGVVLALSIERRTPQVSAKTWAGLIALQTVAVAVVFMVSASGILPEYRFKPPEKVLFETGTQEIDPTYYRSDP